MKILGLFELRTKPKNFKEVDRLHRDYSVEKLQNLESQKFRNQTRIVKTKPKMAFTDL